MDINRYNQHLLADLNPEITLLPGEKEDKQLMIEAFRDFNEGSEEYPLGGLLERYDIERERNY